MVICQACGASNPEQSKYCRQCGAKLLLNEGSCQSSEDNQQSPRTEEETSSAKKEDFKKLYTEVKAGAKAVLDQEPDQRNDTVCPFCQAAECQPTQKNTTEVQSKGYGWGKGCCGMFLLGPFGLLCGLCGMGSKVETKDELWWVCTKCGKQHISLEAALKKWDTAVAALVGSGFACGLEFLLFRWLELGIISLLCELIALITPALGLYQIHKDLSEELGESLVKYLSPQQKRDGLSALGGAMLLAIIIGLFGPSLLNYFLGE